MNRIKVFKDNRGAMIPYNLNTPELDFDQMNISINTNKFTFRGMHFQTNPAQTKLVKVIQGRVVDILYNLDNKEVESYELGLEQELIVPSNYAHGFLTLEPNTIFTYLVSGEYNPNSEHSIVWNTVPEIKSIVEKYIKGSELVISDKDKNGK